MPAIPIQVTLLFILKSGFASGPFAVKLTLQPPSGEEKQIGTFPVLLEGADRGASLTLNLAFQAEEQGLYWFGLSLDRSSTLLGHERVDSTSVGWQTGFVY